jgi:hypothetical protein
VNWPIEDVVMEFLPPGNNKRMSYCCWCEKPSIKSWAAVVFKDPSGLNAFCDFLSGFEELMKK